MRWAQNIPGNLGQYHCSWCPGSWCRQVINRHGIGHVMGRILSPLMMDINLNCLLIHIQEWFNINLFYPPNNSACQVLTHWGRVMHICVIKITIIGVDNGLWTCQRQAITLTHWGRVTHRCVGNLTTIGSDNNLSPCQRQVIILTNAGILLIWLLGINFSEISIEILTLSFKNMRLKVSSAKWWPFCLGLNVLTNAGILDP